MDVWKTLLFILFIRDVTSMLRDFSICHDDFELKPPDGTLSPYTFKWLGFVYYVHVTTSLPHHSVSPRVVLIHKQYVLGTAADLLQLPKNYKLGSIIFGDYERDEDECGLSREQIRMGLSCPRAYFVMPHTEIIPHPEYTRFGIENSLAVVKLLRPMKSAYMLPICLPTLLERRVQRRNRTVFMVDYLSAVPLDIDTENMAKRTLKLYPHRDCRKYRIKRQSVKKNDPGNHIVSNCTVMLKPSAPSMTGVCLWFGTIKRAQKFGSEGITHLLCTSGCGVRPGAPIVSHDVEGPFQLVGLSAGSEPCTRPSMRRRMNDEPPIFIDVYPYVRWIVNVVSASLMPRPYPKNFMLVEGGSSIGIRSSFAEKKKEQRYGWKGRTFVSGNYCYKSSRRQRRTAFFYSEKFSAIAGPDAKLKVFLKVSAGIETTITCARLMVPNHKHTPVIDGVGGFNITVQLDTMWFPESFFFTLGLNGKNSSASNIDLWWSQRGRGMW